MSTRMLTLYYGDAFKAFPWAEIQSYCGQLTPMFVTKEAGRRHLRIGTEDPEFKPWKKEWTTAIGEWIEKSALPETFDEFRGRINLIPNMTVDEWTAFVPMEPDRGQVLGHVVVNRTPAHMAPIVSLGAGVPIVERLYRIGLISADEGIAIVKSMVRRGLSESFTEEFASEYRGREPRFAWETYATERVIKSTFF